MYFFSIRHFVYFTSQCVFSALTKIDVYDFGGALVDEHVVEVPIADSQDVPAHARGGHAVDVRSASFVPHGGLRKAHFEELVKHRFYLCADGVEVAQFLLVRLVGRVLQHKSIKSNRTRWAGYFEIDSTSVRILVLRTVLGVGATVAASSRQVFPDRHRVLHPLQYPAPHRQRHDLVRPDSEILRLFVDGEEAVHHGEDLLHHRVLSQVVLSFDQLGPARAVGGLAGDPLGGVDAPHVAVHFAERSDTYEMRQLTKN
jgi:hypothetical protein